MENPLKAWGVKIAKRSGTKRARAAIARKLPIIMHRIWLEHLSDPVTPDCGSDRYPNGPRLARPGLVERSEIERVPR